MGSITTTEAEIPSPEETHSHDDSQPAGSPTLEPQLDARWALRPVHLALVVCLSLLFLLINYFPLRGTDLWAHTLYGRLILQNHVLPQQDPFMPLAEGMSVTDTAWLSQVVFAGVERIGGAEALSSLFAIVVLVTYLVLARTYYLASGRASMALVGILLVVVVGWSRLATVRPENFATLCFAVLLWLIVAREPEHIGAEEDSDGRTPRPIWRWLLWLGVPVVMAFWANLHGSFVCGLAVLGCYFVGAVIEVAWRTRSLAQVLADRSVRSWLYALELGVAATLINPYGIDLLLQTMWFSTNENLRDILEWQPLVILGIGGREFAMSWVVLLLVMRHSRRRVPAAHALMLGVFALLTVMGIRMLTWYAVVYAFVLVPHLGELWVRFSQAWQARSGAEGVLAFLNRPSLKYTLFCIFLPWIAFCLSPISTPLFGGEPRTSKQLYGESTPVKLTEYLRENPPSGQIFNPQWWGDWLVWDGPAELQPFATSNVHVMPSRVWRDYMRIASSEAGWTELLPRYKIETVIFDKNQQRNQSNTLRRDEQWRVAYEDQLAIVFKHRGKNRGSTADVSETSGPGAAAGKSAEDSTAEVEQFDPIPETQNQPPADSGKNGDTVGNSQNDGNKVQSSSANDAAGSPDPVREVTNDQLPGDKASETPREDADSPERTDP